MLLAGDIGATKTLIGLFSPAPVRPDPIDVRSYVTFQHDSLETIVDEFLSIERSGPRLTVTGASFGVAGPIVEQVGRLTNVPWKVDAAAIARQFSIPRATLLNDLEAMAYSVPVLEANEIAVLQAGRRVRSGNAALIAAGTGLGEALLHNVNGQLIPSPTEGGHGDFAPRTPREIGLLEELIRLYGRADYERVLSGPGLVNVHRFVHPRGCPAWDGAVDPAHAPSLISRAALEGRCPQCVEALDLFVSVYGAEAGNLALRSVASAGLFLGGGIAPKILPALRQGPFLEAFLAKAPMAEFVSAVPVAVILNDRAGLLGAAVHANLAEHAVR
ncbi:MAG TPA: glucokinase [Vicinamibacterales bacterium]|jgi:glucokinase